MDIQSQALIDRIKREYNPERDMPHDPHATVSYIEYDIITVIEDLNAEIATLQQRVEELESSLRKGLFYLQQ